MAKRRTKSRTLNLTAKSEQRKGFTMPTIKKIKSALIQRSKTFLVSLIMSMFSKLSKTAKISMLMRIDRKSIGKKRKTRRKSSTKRRKTTRKSKAKNGRKKPRTAKQKAASKRNIKKARAARKRR